MAARSVSERDNASGVLREQPYKESTVHATPKLSSLFYLSVKEVAVWVCRSDRVAFAGCSRYRLIMPASSKAEWRRVEPLSPHFEGIKGEIFTQRANVAGSCAMLLVKNSQNSTLTQEYKGSSTPPARPIQIAGYNTRGAPTRSIRYP